MAVKKIVFLRIEVVRYYTPEGFYPVNPGLYHIIGAHGRDQVYFIQAKPTNQDKTLG